MARRCSAQLVACASLLFVAISRSGADPGCWSETCDATSLLATRVAPPKGRIERDANHQEGFAQLGPAAGSLAQMESLVEKQVVKHLGSMKGSSSGSSALPLPPDVAKSFDIVRAHIDTVEEHMPKEHKADQGAINSLLSPIAGCFEPSVDDETDQRREDHSKCRVEEGDLAEVNRTDCVRHDDAKVAMQPTPCTLDDYPHGMSNESADLKEEYTDCLQKLDTWAGSVQALWAAWQKCEQAGKLLASTRKVCNAKQISFEDEFCKLYKSCECYDRNVQRYEQAIAEFKDAEASRQADFRSGARVDCMLKVFEVDASMKAEAYSNCTSKAINITHLQLDYGIVPEPGANCTLPAGKPGDDSWEEEEYKEQPWYPKAPTQTLKPCDFTSTVTTTTTTTTTVMSSIAPGNVELLWANCIGQAESDIGSCCDTADHTKSANNAAHNPDWCRSFGQNPDWQQVLALDEHRNLLVQKSGKMWRLTRPGSGAAIPEAIEHQHGGSQAFTYNPKNGDMYYVVQYNCGQYLSEEQRARADALEAGTGFPLSPKNKGPSLLKQTASGNISVAFGMCSYGNGACDPSDSRCSGRNRELGQMYMDRLYEVNAGAEIDPNVDISIHYTIPAAVVVDPDTNDLYVVDRHRNYWPSRWVVWKYDAAKQTARLVAGHFNSLKLTGLNYHEMNGFGGSATAAHLGRVVCIALHPATKELHIVVGISNLAKVDADGNLQKVECEGCKSREISAIAYHKREQQWVVMGGNLILWQNGTIIAGTKTRPTKRIYSYKDEADRGPWIATERSIQSTGPGNMALDEAANELYFTDAQPGAVMVVNLSPA